MANKTIAIRLIDFIGKTGLVLKLTAEGSSTVVNGSGDTLTEGSLARFTCTVTEALAGIYDVIVEDSGGNIVYGGGDDSKVWIYADIAATFVVGSLSDRATYFADQQYYQPVVRSIDDNKAISFLWQTTGRTITGTKVIDGTSSGAITGAITEIGSVGAKYEYSIAYNAADRPTTEGTVRYALTDGANTRYLTVRIDDIAAAMTVTPLVGTVVDNTVGTAIAVYTGDLKTVAVAVVDTEGSAVDVSGMSLELTFESGSSEVIINNASITKTGSTFSFVTTSTLTSVERLWKWALRKTTDDAVLLHGTLEVTYAPAN